MPRIEYLGGTYASLNDVLNLIAPNFSQYWVKTDDTNYSQLRTQDLEFKSGASLGDGAASYYTYPQVKSGVTLYKKNNENSSYTPLTSEEFATVNSSLKAYHALVWTNGKCYYTTTIQHLGASGIPKYGVVRNHVYQVNITDIEGMGTPVYDPDNDEITPTVPKDENTYLAARVNVLAWKVVASDVTLSSGNN